MKRTSHTKLGLFIILILVFFAAWTNGEGIKEEVNAATVELKPVMKEFKVLIDSDPTVRMYFTQMIDQVPGYYRNNPNPNLYINSIDQMLYLINAAIDKAPVYDETDLVGFPINDILNWTMGVPAGFTAFRNEKVNSIFKKILDEYGSYLDSPASLSVLNDGPTGWKSKAAMQKLNMDQYQYDPNDEHWGFKSWNDFFTRKFKPGVRPIAEPSNNKAIVSACDSNVYNIQYNVKKLDWFWVKSQPYSLNDMLNNDESVADRFVGGDVYQAFLSATKYHRWHSPVTGTIKKAYIKQGTYYAGTESQGMDPGSPNFSQGYIAHVATRAIIYIEADDPQIGLMVVMPIGMAEVSSCVIPDKIKPGYRIRKGEELRYFQYGGSTYCLIFRPGVIKRFEVKEGDDVKMGQAIAIAN
ncbi:MAG: phosphatidylserine decarboxylase family protein [Proteobacteria bacterium]|nr:phosphatidylserine decarboxylase family protein [Pseudomonadota bacterium]MBU4583327.1 phosphatidylserine decarboxylase family protein [Pseudomonadota bacterium]